MRHSEKVKRWIASSITESVDIQYECPECFASVTNGTLTTRGTIEWVCRNGHTGVMS